MSFEFEQPHNQEEEILEVPPEESFLQVGNLDEKGRDELRALLEEVRKKS